MGTGRGVTLVVASIPLRPGDGVARSGFAISHPARPVVGNLAHSCQGDRRGRDLLEPPLRTGRPGTRPEDQGGGSRRGVDGGELQRRIAARAVDHPEPESETVPGVYAVLEELPVPTRPDGTAARAAEHSSTAVVASVARARGTDVGAEAEVGARTPPFSKRGGKASPVTRSSMLECGNCGRPAGCTTACG